MRAWMRRGLLAWVLAPLALLFLLASQARRALYRHGMLNSTRLPVPVVVVGNVFIGGTGKTPLTIWLVDALRTLGYVPGVISRGYGARPSGKPCVVGSDATAVQVGDEPLLIARRACCPVVVGRDRVAAAQVLLASFPEVNLILSDDGLQHYALQRDVEIVLSDERGDGNGWVLPAGPLREPASRARDFTVVNGAETSDHAQAAASAPIFSMRLQALQAVRLGDPAQTISLEALAGDKRRILAAAGIGHPQRFFALLRAAGVVIDQELPLPDHYDFADNPFDKEQAAPAELILITEKDAVKCLQLEPLRNDSRIWVVPVSACIDIALAHQIVEKCRGFPTA